MKEQWIDIDGYEGFYQVSDLGRVRSLDRVVMNGGVPRKRCGKILSSRNSLGRPRVHLSLDGKKKLVCVAGAVCRAFYGPPPSKLHWVLHKNGDTTDDRAENIRWEKGQRAKKYAHHRLQQHGRND